MTAPKIARRVYVADDLAAGVVLVLPALASHHVAHVLRMRTGDSLALFNGRDGEWQGEISEVRKARCAVRIVAQVRPQVREPDVWLAFAPLKKARIDWLVEKAGELGAALLLPVMTQRTNAERVNVDRLSAIAIEASQQCGRLSVATVRPPVALPILLAEWPRDRKLFVLDESGGGRPIAAALADHADKPAGFLIGPEGGFAPEEAALWRTHAFVTPVGLGRRLLRAETAAMAALAAWQAVAGDWR